MSCPEWRSATAWRRGDGAAPPGWQASLDHLAGCTPCRQRLAELDPSLLLAAAAAPAPAVGEDEIRTLAATVRSLIAAQRLEARSRPDRRALFAAVVLVALLATPLGVRRFADRSAQPAAPDEVAVVLSEPADEPPIEEVQPARARVYQFGAEDLPVVLIVDESLDL